MSNSLVCTARGGTDAAVIVLFWPDNLPNDADQTLSEDPIQLIDELHRDGKLIRFPCDGDGDYTIAIYFRSEIPPHIAQYCREIERHSRLTVQGDGYFGAFVAVFIAVAVSRTRLYKAVAAARAEYEREFPAFIVRLD